MSENHRTDHFGRGLGRSSDPIFHENGSLDEII